MTYTIDADGNFSVDEPDAVAALGALLGAMQGRMDAEGRARREPTEEERAEMERIREEFLDVDDLPEGMSVPASVPPPGLDSTADAATGSDPLNGGSTRLKRGSTRSRPFDAVDRGAVDGGGDGRGARARGHGRGRR